MKKFFAAKQRNNGVSFLSSSASKYTNIETERARKARHIQECLMWPSDGELKRVLSTKAITGSDVTFEDVKRANLLFGKAKEISAGKMTVPTKVQNSSSQVLLHDLVPSVNH